MIRRKSILLLALVLMLSFAAASCSKQGADVQIYAFKCGVLKTQTQYMLKDTRVGTPMDIPVTFFLIKHGNDWVAFDTGNNGKCATEPEVYWGEVSKAYMPVMKTGEEFKVQIKRDLGIEPKDIKCVILSHGHLDHAGAIEDFVGTNVPIYMQKRELANINAAIATGKKTAYIPEDFTLMQQLNIKTYDGIFDVFKDQTVVTFPTPGHTPGHQSMMVKQTKNNKIVILCADAEYTLENMMEFIPPGLAWDIPQATQNLYVFMIMKWFGPNVEIVPSHDPHYWPTKPLAPAQFVF